MIAFQLLEPIPHLRPVERLGFGCSNLLGDKTRAEGRSLLDAAFDAGIRHIDVARYYGYGDAEGIVGEFARGKRDRITITTKFGLQPLKSMTALRGPIEATRRMMRSSPLVRRFVRRGVRSLVSRGCFDVQSARESLETSLRELKTDYIDCYLLHECSAADCSDELVAFLLRARTEGKIRAFGVGASFVRTIPLLATWPELTRIAQFEHNVFASEPERTARRAAARGRRVITHGVLSTIEPLRARLRDDAAFAERARAATGCDLREPGVLASFALHQAQRDNPDGFTIFRASSAERIAANVRALEAAPPSDAALTAFESIAAAV
jgi:aryl-alcohol dehydrogenase-like predicted oxidoreductase